MGRSIVSNEKFANRNIMDTIYLLSYNYTTMPTTMMPSKKIKEHYGEFNEVARRNTVIHTNHGRPTLVTVSIDRAREMQDLKADLAEVDMNQRKGALTSLIGAGEQYSRFRSDNEIVASIRNLRDAW